MYLGNAEKIKALVANAKSAAVPERLQVYEYGSLWLCAEIEKDLDISRIVEQVVGKKKVSGINIGDYFFYAIINRMIDPCSKHGLSSWYKATAIQDIRPCDVNALNSSNFWKAWQSVSESQIREITKQVARKIALLHPLGDQSRNAHFQLESRLSAYP